jgi:hypothetical protein
VVYKLRLFCYIAFMSNASSDCLATTISFIILSSLLDLMISNSTAYKMSYWQCRPLELEMSNSRWPVTFENFLIMLMMFWLVFFALLCLGCYVTVSQIIIMNSASILSSEA